MAHQLPRKGHCEQCFLEPTWREFPSCHYSSLSCLTHSRHGDHFRASEVDIKDV